MNRNRALIKQWIYSVPPPLPPDFSRLQLQFLYCYIAPYYVKIACARCGVKDMSPLRWGGAKQIRSQMFYNGNIVNRLFLNLSPRGGFSRKITGKRV